MPTYLIEGKKVKTEKPLTEAEIDEIASSIKAPAAAQTEIPQRRMPSLADVGDRATGFRAQVAETGMTPQERQEAVRTGAAFTGGMLVGPALAGVVRGTATVIPALQRFVPAITPTLETGGFRTGLPATASRARQLTTRAAGGAVTGAGAAALVEPEDTVAGATVGTTIATLTPPVARIVAKGGGAIADALAGRTADARANELIRTAANNEVNALRQAMAANPDVPASRAAADLNLPVLQALLARAEQRDPRQVVNAFRQRESQDIVNQLSRIAGGPTAETARAAREGTKESLAGITAPMREEALAAARRTGEVVPRLETIAAEAREEAAKQVDIVRRFTPAIERAEEWAKSWSKLAGPRFAQPGDLAARIPAVVDRAAQESLRAGARARAAENTIKMRTERGETPITVGKLTSSIDSVLRKPDIAANTQATTALKRIKSMLADRAMENGVLDPADVYAIRKYGVSSVIEELSPGADMRAKDRLTASVLTEIKPLLTKAIEDAGGKDFGNYLDSFEKGMSSIRGMELADQMRKLYAKGTPEAKEQIINLVRGESPEAIEELFGSGRYKISEEMAKDMPFLTKLADTLDLDRKAVEQAAAGRAALTEAEKKGSARIRFPFFTRASTAVNEVVAGLEQRMKAETLDVLIRAAQSGREFNRVLDQIPARDKNAFLKQFKDAESWNKFAGQVAQAAQAQVSAEPRNRLAPASSNQLRAQ